MEVSDIAIRGNTSTESEGITVLHLKSILKCLASSHSKYFGKVFTQFNYSLNETKYKNLQSVLFDLTRIINAENIDINLFKEGVEKLSLCSEDTLKSNKNNVYVRSEIFKSKLCFESREDRSMECKIIDVEPEKYLPLVCDVLLAIFHFTFSVTKIRQYHFHELLDYYYNTLEEILHNTDLDLSSIMPRDEYDMQIKKSLPFIKLETAYWQCEEILQKVKTENKVDWKICLKSFLNEDKNYENSISTLILEVYECIIYPNLSKEDCFKIVRNNVGPGEYEFLNWKLTPVDVRGGNLGDYFNLKINIKRDNEQKTLHLFAKYLPTTNSIALEIATVSFYKEEFFYDTFISELKSLRLEDITDFVPNCYFSRSNDVLIFEDVSFLNYRSLNPSEPLPYETMHVVIKQMTKLHACSFLYEDILTEKTGKLVRISDKYEKYIQEITLRLNADNNINKIITCGINAVLDYMLEEFPDIPKNMTMEAFKVKVKTAFDLLYEKVKKSNKYRNTLCQGDYWGNNILFKMDKHNKPITCYIIDYQQTRYCPPSLDLLFFLYVNTDKATRSKYMTKLIEEYYKQLSNILINHNSDLNKIYTYEDFLNSCHYMKSAAICIASLHLQFSRYPPEKLQKILLDEVKSTYVFNQDRKEMLDEMHCNKLYRQSLKDNVEDLYEVCENDIL